jgi:predicted DNA-binding protein (MmcQ/YjbR family)
MHLDAYRDLCLGLPHVTEDQPFGPDVLVFRIGGKIFALLGLDRYPPTVTLKCDPERAVEMRALYADVQPGYHMNKQHWNTVGLQGDVPATVLRDLTRHACAVVRAGLPKGVRAALDADD